MSRTGLGPTQAEALEFVRERWPWLADPQSRLNKVAEEHGEMWKAWVQSQDGTGRKALADLAQETAQTVICIMALAESLGFDLDDEIADEWERANQRVWPSGREGPK